MKMREISGLPEELSAYQERLYALEVDGSLLS